MLHSIEPLEVRIAPATLVGKALTYTDIDGDKVTITFTNGTYADTDFTFDSAFNTAGSQQLRSLNFSGDTDKSKTSITMKVTRVAGGDGQAHVGWINANGIDLGTVSLLGDLGRIVAGESGTDVVGVKALKVASMGSSAPTRRAVPAASPVMSPVRSSAAATITAGSSIPAERSGMSRSRGTSWEAAAAKVRRSVPQGKSARS